MATVGLGKIVLYSSNPGAVSAFYAATTGLEFERVGDTQRYEAEDKTGVRLIIEAALDPLPKGRRENALTFFVENLDNIAMRLREDGWDVGMVLDRPSGKTTLLTDPDGRNVELFEPRKAPALIEKPAEIAPPALVQKPSEIAPPALIEKPAQVESKETKAEDKPAEQPKEPEKSDALTPPALVDKPPVRLEMHTALELDDKSKAEAETKAEEKPAEAAPTEKRGTEPPPPPALVGTPGPMLSAAKPGKLSCQGGMKLTLYGANFAEGCRILVDNDDTTNPRRLDDFTIEIETPAHAPGPAEVIVENPDGQRAVIRVAYDEGPIIERFEPHEGSPRGGTEIKVIGRNFQDGCRITFFNNRAPEVHFDNEKQIRFFTPPQEDLFHGEIRLTNPDGLGATAQELFTYRLATPHIAAISPSTGLIGGDKRVQVTGVDFHPRAIARLGGKTATITVKNAETIELITPRQQAPGAVDLEIENPDGQVAKLLGAFTYEPEPTPPLLVEVRPLKGYCQGGSHIRLIGDNFEADTVVRLGEVRCVSRWISKHEIEIDLPARPTPGLVAIELTDRHGITVRREDAFTYETRPAPRVESVTPRNGPMVGGTKLVIEGELFDENIFVRIGGQTPKRVVVRSPSVLEVIAPPSKASGFVDVEVGSQAGTSVSKNAFRYDPSPAPAIESIAPNKGAEAGGTEVSIEGKNFTAESVVLFGKTPATRVKFVSAQTLEAKAPAGKNGEMVDITVRNPDGKEATTKRAFLYDARYRG